MGVLAKFPAYFEEPHWDQKLCLRNQRHVFTTLKWCFFKIHLLQQILNEVIPILHNQFGLSLAHLNTSLYSIFVKSQLNSPNSWVTHEKDCMIKNLENILIWIYLTFSDLGISKIENIFMATPPRKKFFGWGLRVIFIIQTFSKIKTPQISEVDLGLLEGSYTPNPPPWEFTPNIYVFFQV